MEQWTQTMGAGPLLGIAAGAVAVILVLIIRFRLHAFLTLILVSLATALATGIPLARVVPTMTEGFGKTLASVALLVGLGAMLGRLVETSGGAQALADALVRRFGEKRAPFALGVASLIMGFPIFFDAGLVVMLPIVFATARRMHTPVLVYGLPAAAAFSVMHVYLPPHPGPIAAAGFYGVSVGAVLIVALIVAFPLWYVAGYLLGVFLGRRFPASVPGLLSGGPQDDDQPRELPAASSVIGIMMLPMVLIFANTGFAMAAASGVVDPTSPWVMTLRLLGQTPIALLIATLVAMVVLGTRRGQSVTAIEKTLEQALGPVCSVILITGAGGMFGEVLRASGIGAALSGSLANLGVPLILAAYLVALVLRVAQGSATVALTTAAALMAPAVETAGFSALKLASIVLATAAGSVFASHVNDSGFWLVGRLMGMDVATTLKTWTLSQAAISLLGFGLVSLCFMVLP